MGHVLPNSDLVTDTVYDFQWKLPRHKSADIPLVVYGYYRRVNVPIISDIIQTMIDYFAAFEDRFDLHNLVKMSVETIAIIGVVSLNTNLCCLC